MELTLAKNILLLLCAFALNVIATLFNIPVDNLSDYIVMKNLTTQTITECYMKCNDAIGCDDVALKDDVKGGGLKRCAMLHKRKAKKDKPCILKTFDAFSNTFIMDAYRSVPVSREGNEFRYGTVDKLPYKKGEYFTYETTRTGPAGWQFFGWKSKEFSLRNITFKFSINFEASVPAKSSQFGFKVYGVVYNDWVSSCHASTWCNIKQTVQVRKEGDKEQVILLFDSITDIRKIHFAALSVDILR